MHSRNLLSWVRNRIVLNTFFVIAVLITLVAGYTFTQTFAHSARSSSPLSANQAFTQASQETGVPVALLKAICYMEGRLSNNGGEPSVDNGFGCMHLVKSQNADTLDKAAKELGVSVKQLKQDLGTNIRGGAFILRDDALQISSTLPANLADWYGAVAAYSNASLRSIALMYADGVYKIIQQGFSSATDQGEAVILAAQVVKPNTTTAFSIHTPATLPGGCKSDSNVDYPGAIDCVIVSTPAARYDCNDPLSPSSCNYTGSDRPTSCTVEFDPTNIVVTQPCKVDQVVIHDTEGSLASALSEFMCIGNGGSGCVQSSVQYIVDTDGEVYQVVREANIAYHDGNFWSNMHSIGIEHIGFDATGYKWYNATQYLASAKLVAYLVNKYHIPLDHSHIISHGTVPASTLAAGPNHVDPGPYWLWDYYFNLISQQGGGTYNASDGPPNTITLHPVSDQQPDGSNGTETTANFNFFYLYKGPSTKSGLIPQQGDGTDITDVSYSVEADVSYYYVAKASDAGGTGDTMYEIWYGEEDQVHTSNPSYYADGKLAWLAVPAGDGVEGKSTGLTHSSTRVVLYSPGGGTVPVYSRPTSGSTYVIGGAPSGAIFTTAFALTEDNTNNLWYEINFNHRQAWIPASETPPLHAN